jgi:hypothetical protein
MMTIREWLGQEPKPMSRYRFAKEVGITASYVTRLCKPNPPFPRKHIRRIEAVTQGRVTAADWIVGPAQMDWIESPPPVKPGPVAAPVPAPEPKPQPRPRPEAPVYASWHRKHKRFVSLSFFVREMMGKKNLNWFYLHCTHPDFPKRIYLPGAHRPVLSYDECIAFQNKGTTTPPWKSQRRPRLVLATNNDYHD